MNIKKEREAFQECYKTSRDYKFYVRHEMSEKQIFEFKKGKYVVDCVNDGWEIWQAAKASAVPDGYLVVPKEPTEAMVQAGKDSSECGGWPDEIYRAIIEAQESIND